MKKKNHSWKVFRAIFNLIFAILNIGVAFIHTLVFDLPRNIKTYIIMAINKEERDKIRRKLSLEKNQELMEERLEVVERLVYAVYNDPTYAKRKEGEYDLKELKKRVEK
ncbi:hypothetical protein D6777_00345 [Candidatus Woesearchaeota archaeon]|nr:MAG: hypothetical protein D6777_00345 [Candidatus Woesearchaeota archaeon]